MREFYETEQYERARIKKDDVLLNSTGIGTLGRASCFQYSDNAIADNHVTRLIPDDTICDPSYLALFLNSFAGISQSEQHQSGSSGQLELISDHIQEFLVFIPKNSDGKIDIDWQRKLGNMVKKAEKAKHSSRELFNSGIELANQLVG